eukprot:759786-Hanusia_phi.AAC.1
MSLISILYTLSLAAVGTANVRHRSKRGSGCLWSFWDVGNLSCAFVVNGRRLLEISFGQSFAHTKVLGDISVLVVGRLRDRILNYRTRWRHNCFEQDRETRAKADSD